MSDTAHIQPILKVCFIHGLQEIVLAEILAHTELLGKIHLLDREVDCLYFTIGDAPTFEDDDETSTIQLGNTQHHAVDNRMHDAIDSSTLNQEMYSALLSLKSVTHIFLVKVGSKLHPQYINTHKSILGNMIKEVIDLGVKTSIGKSPFKTFKLRCAGSDSPEVISIQNYISETFKIKSSDEADLDMYIHKPDTLWEIGVRITPRPLSVREYKVEHIKGGMNPTVAYAMDTFALKHLFARIMNVASTTNTADTTETVCTTNTSVSTESNNAGTVSIDDIESTETFSYLNICSGSATLLIEAGIALGNTKLHSGNIKLLGFDSNKKTNSQAVRNILHAGLIQYIQIKNADLLDKPDFGDTLGDEFNTFDAITADLPFGMQIGKDEDLAQLYKTFVEYCTSKLKQNGVLVVYTTETETFERALRNSMFRIEKDISLRIITSAGSHIQPSIFVCVRK